MKTVLHRLWTGCGCLMCIYFLWMITRLLALDTHVCPICDSIMHSHQRKFPPGIPPENIVPIREWECHECGLIIIK